MSRAGDLDLVVGDGDGLLNYIENIAVRVGRLRRRRSS